MNLTINDFITIIARWAAGNADRIQSVGRAADQWEVWAQIEIAAHIREVVPHAWIDRDARVYPDGGRADFLLNNPIENAPSDEIVVELTCENRRDWDGFLRRLEYDHWKLRGQMSLDLNAANKISLGIFFPRDTDNAVVSVPGYDLAYTPRREVGILSMIF
ncbi:hypothetical protein [Brevundimonas sp.]|uniref:hypothetical protein n=1 Tax=Brevundimonas sp. TaxID=1871086 RepID=UPI0037BF56D2